MKRRNNILNNKEKKEGAVCYVCYIPDLSSFIYSKRMKLTMF